MRFISIRVITADAPRLVAFYEQVFQVKATWSNELFAELKTSQATLAIADARTLAFLGTPVAVPGMNQSVILEFLVDDVDGLHAALDTTVPILQVPTTMPWGNRSLLLRDPDGNLVNVFTPQTDAARQKFGLAGR